MLRNNIKQIREERELSQDELAEKAGTKRNYLGKLERSERRLNMTLLCNIASALEVEPWEIIGPYNAEDRKTPPWLPRDSTLAAFLEAVLPALSANPGSQDVLLDVAHEIGSLLRTLARRPSDEDDPVTVRTLANVLADRTEPGKLGKSRSTPSTR